MIEERAVVLESNDESVVFQIIRTGACNACAIRENCYRNDGVVSVSRDRIRTAAGARPPVAARDATGAAREPASARNATGAAREPGAGGPGRAAGSPDPLEPSGNSVMLRIPQTSVLGLTAVVYGLPLVAFVAGLLLGYFVLFPNAGPALQPLGAFGSAVALLGGAGAIIARFDRRVQERISYVVEPARGKAAPAPEQSSRPPEISAS